MLLGSPTTALWHISGWFINHEVALARLMPYLLVFVVLTCLWVVNQAIIFIRHRSIRHLPGPPSGPWLIGHMAHFLRPKEAGEAEVSFTKRYGPTLRVGGPLGRDIILTADPKALQYILNTSGYSFPKTADRRLRQEIIVGRGVLWAEGAQHARQRKVMNPAFSFSALRSFIPIFRDIARKGVKKIKEQLTEEKPMTVDILSSLHKMTLDVIGEVGFGYKFHAVDNNRENKLAMVYENLMPQTYMEISNTAIALEALIIRLPSWMTSLLTKLKVGRFKLLHEHREAAREVAEELIQKETTLVMEGKQGSKDVLSRLVQANLSEDLKTKLSGDEIIPQMTTLMLAGHDTTALTTAWFLYEAAKHPEYQKRLRAEIHAAREVAFDRGDTELSIADLDSMEYMLAAMKETLRYHAILPNVTREAGKDDVIPLDFLQTGKTGEVITNVPVSKGQVIILSLHAYNRLPQVWGADADEWKPERFLLQDMKKNQKTNLGVMDNISTFSSGLRGCIGWRFAILEMQALLVELLENFEFSIADNIEIIPAFAALRTPFVSSRKERVGEMPLIVRPL